MVTFTDIQKTETEMAKAYKQVQINTAELRQYIDIIGKRVKENGDEVRRFALELDPPYPIASLEDAFINPNFPLGHLAELELITHTALLKMVADLNQISSSELTTCIQEYNALPVPTLNKDRYKGTESPGFRDTMLNLSNKIGKYLDTQSFKPAYLKRGDAINHRATISIAIIYLGRKLMAEKESATKPNSENN
jgi:hypothetical protein